MFEGKKVIDVHGHMTTPPTFRAAVAGMVSQNTPPHGIDIPDEALANANKRHIDMLDDHQIDFQLLSPRPIAMWHWMRPFLQHAWAENTNDVIAQICKLFPDRFAGVAQLPQSRDEDTSHVLDELNRAVNDLGFVGALVNPDPGGDKQTPGLHEEYWYPLYERAEELGVVLMVHPALTFDKRVEMVHANYQLNNVVEEFIAMQLLEHGTVFDDFPKLKVFVCHGGGALHRFIAEDRHRGQRDLSNNLWFDTCVLERNVLEATIKQKSAKQMLFGTEAPGSGGQKRPESGRPSDDLVPVIGEIDFLSTEDKHNIFHDNAFNAVPRLEKVLEPAAV